MPLLEGKGYYIWKVHRCEGGDPRVITRKAQAAGLTHVLIKIADGSRAYNVDLAEELADALKSVGIKVWGWQFVYGNEPFQEADIALHRIKTLDLAGFVVNAETDYYGKYAEAGAYMQRLRSRYPKLPVGLSSFRYPHYHPQFPWTEFLTHCDINMPQVYWVRSDNPEEQIDRCINQFQDIYPIRPIIPTGSAYEEFGWRPSVDEIQAFLRHARTRGLSGANFWSWDYAGSPEGEDFWHVIAGYNWPVKEIARDTGERLFELMTEGDVEKVMALYHQNAVLVTSHDAYYGKEQIARYYVDLLTQQLPGATFTSEAQVNEGYARHLRWDAFGSMNGRTVKDAHDTMMLKKGAIRFHSSIYQIR